MHASITHPPPVPPPAPTPSPPLLVHPPVLLPIQGPAPSKIYPLPHMYVLKDLVPDLTNFYDQVRGVAWRGMEGLFMNGFIHMHAQGR